MTSPMGVLSRAVHKKQVKFSQVFPALYAHLSFPEFGISLMISLCLRNSSFLEFGIGPMISRSLSELSFPEFDTGFMASRA